MKFFDTPRFDFVKWRWHAIALSLLVVIAGSVAIWRGYLGPNARHLGVDFAGGTLVVVQFNQHAPVERVRAAVGTLPGGAGNDAVVQQYGEPSQNQVMIRVAGTGAENADDLSDTADALVAALKQSNLGAFEVISTEIVGPVVGDQLKRQGTLATVFAMAGILAYIAFRFQFSFAVGAIAATLHDLLITLSFLAFFQYDLTLNVIAGLLTITGYSVNDTIVIFDRVRENLRAMRRDNLSDIVNVAVNQTLSRTVITAGTTLLSVVALYLYGGEVLEGFAFTMLVGIISGTYSTVFIAAAIAIMLQGRKPIKGQMASPSTSERKPSRRRAS
jgi:preprotein translocase subunit SecF